MKTISLKSQDPGDLAEKTREVAILSKMRHAHINRYQHTFIENGSLHIISDYCDKGDLEKYIKNQNGERISEQRVKRFFVETLLAVEYLHSHGIIHRDLKPSNIFLRGPEYSVQLGDFGIACVTNTAVIVEDVGTLYY